jgi:hypothetical protein
MEYAILLIVGFYVGIIVFRLPSSRWLKREVQLDKDAFKAAYPEKYWIYFLYT